MGVVSAVALLFRLVALFFVKPHHFRVFSTGVHVSASQLLSLPQWIGKRFVTVNKRLLRQYCTRSDGDEKTLPVRSVQTTLGRGDIFQNHFYRD